MELNNQYLEQNRTEEVQEIIDRMPTKFGFGITIIIILIFIFLGGFGWLIRYPDIVSGKININSGKVPLKIIANTNGRLKLLGMKNFQKVKKGQIMGIVENSTNLKSIQSIDSLLDKIQINDFDVLEIKKELPQNVSAGEINLKYYSFISALQNLVNYIENKSLDNQNANLKKIHLDQGRAISTAIDRVEMSKKTLLYVQKFYSRDSLLFSKKVISESELDKSELSFLNAKDAYQNSMANLISLRQASQQTSGKLQELSIAKPEKELELRLQLISSYNDLQSNIKTWKEKYLFIAPFDGTIQFLKFYNEDQFIQAGEQIFKVVPHNGVIEGQVILPASGSGKIKVGQEVIVKLDNFPYLEYGSINGQVKSISLTTSTFKNGGEEIEAYLVSVKFPTQLKTNYGISLTFRADAIGEAEIITNDRRLIERLFDNLHYSIQK